MQEAAASLSSRQCVTVTQCRVYRQYVGPRWSGQPRQLRRSLLQNPAHLQPRSPRPLHPQGLPRYRLQQCGSCHSPKTRAAWAKAAMSPSNVAGFVDEFRLVMISLKYQDGELDIEFPDRRAEGSLHHSRIQSTWPGNFFCHNTLRAPLELGPPGPGLGPSDSDSGCHSKMRALWLSASDRSRLT